MGKNLLELKSLDVSEIRSILDQAQAFHDGQVFRGCEGRIAANLFFEPSTRTQYSFHVVDEKLGLRVVSFNPAGSSLQKNESFYDTVKTFDSFGVDLLVIRHVENEYYNQLTGRVNAKILNGGDGTGNHPTQSLLDLLTIRQQFGGFEGLKVAIVGDLLHSRIAKSNIWGLTKMGADVCVSGPPTLLLPDIEKFGVKVYYDAREAVNNADVILTTRMRMETQDKSFLPSLDEYKRLFRVDDSLLRYAKKDAIVMHPGPIQRGIEISARVIDSKRCIINDQIANSVAVRMAILYILSQIGGGMQ